jgi:hypothetical protein
MDLEAYISQYLNMTIILTAFLTRLRAGAYHTTSEPFSALIDYISSCYRLFGSDNPAGVCLLTFLKDVESAVASIVPELFDRSLPELDHFIASVEELPASAPNSLEEFLEWILDENAA